MRERCFVGSLLTFRIRRRRWMNFLKYWEERVDSNRFPRHDLSLIPYL